MKKKISLFLFLLFSVILKTTFSQFLRFLPVFPDIPLIVLVFMAVRYGSVTGQIAGFGTGLLEDFASLAPLGFNSLIRMITGQLTGLLQGRMNMDPVLFPILSVTTGTLLKGFLSYLIAAVFNISYSGSIFVSGSFVLELVLNALTAPILFLLLRLVLDWILRERKTL